MFFSACSKRSGEKVGKSQGMARQHKRAFSSEEIYGSTFLTCCVCCRLWHQTTLTLEELVKAPVFYAGGNTELLDIYRQFLQDQKSGSGWTGFACKISPVKHASLAITIAKQFQGKFAIFVCCLLTSA